MPNPTFLPRAGLQVPGTFKVPGTSRNLSRQFPYSSPADMDAKYW